MSSSTFQQNFGQLNDSVLIARAALAAAEYEANDTSIYYPTQDDSNDCLYLETQLERNRYEEEGYYELELFTHYLSGFGGLSLAIIGLVLNSFCAFTLCRAAVFRAHLVFLCAVSIANALQLSCLIVILTRDIRQPDPRYLNMLPRIYIKAFLQLYPLSKFFHLAMAWLVMASTIDCWRWIKKAQIKEEKMRARSIKKSRSLNKSNSSNFELIPAEPDMVKVQNRAKCRTIMKEVLAIAGIALIALIYTVPSAWENKGDILLLGKIGTDTNCTAFIYHLMQTDVSQTALYRIGYSLLGHLVLQTGIPLVASSIAIAKISRQLQITSTSLGQLVTDAVELAMRADERGIDRQQMPTPSYSQRVILENRNIIHCSLFLSVFTFYVCHVPQLWAKIQWSLMHVESHQNSHMKYVNEFVNFMTVANAAVNGIFILCFCRRYIADGARDIDMCAWCFHPKDGHPRKGGICNKAEPSGSSEQGEEQDIEICDYQDPEANGGYNAEMYAKAQSDELPAENGTMLIPPMRHKPSPTLEGSNVAVICDGQYLLEPPKDNLSQQLQYEQPKHRSHHSKRSRSHNRGGNLPQQQQQDYDVEYGIEQGVVPLHYKQQQQLPNFTSQQQYFMGPHSHDPHDIYLAAQV